MENESMSQITKTAEVKPITSATATDVRSPSAWR